MSISIKNVFEKIAGTSNHSVPAPATSTSPSRHTGGSSRKPMDRSKLFRPLTSARTLRRKPLTEMTSEELTDYIYAQLETWPVPLSKEERVNIAGMMLASVQWARQAEKTQAEREACRLESKRKREEAEARLRELNRPKLPVFDIFN